MSYNPAFVFGEALEAQNAANASQSNNGIKLTSFKPLQTADEARTLTLRTKAGNASAKSSRKTSKSKLNNKQPKQATACRKATSADDADIQDYAGGVRQEDAGNKSPLIDLSNTDSSYATTATSIITAATSGASTSGSSSISSSASSASSASVSLSCAAVECRDLRYDVGRGKSHKTILHNINVTIPEGSIYGLLGPSGCGKTTMLRCVIGRVKPKGGYVRVFGYKPNESGSQIPGSAIGYMPQEISVYEDFTIDETLTYFGKINRMKTDLIHARIDFLITFLDLPNKKRLVASLSGGQKRRVSLAAALVHSPPLLILDEPTVGVDPLLRHNIWKHLVTLAQTEKITVLITTHYIEEARQANVVGLMRHGKLLAEESPLNLMSEYGMDSLEEVFLKLCISDSSRRATKLAGLELGDNITSVAPTPELLLKCPPKHPASLRLSQSGRLAPAERIKKSAVANTKLSAGQLPAIFTMAANASMQHQQDEQQQQQQSHEAPLSIVVSSADSDNKLTLSGNQLESQTKAAGGARQRRHLKAGSAQQNAAANKPQVRQKSCKALANNAADLDSQEDDESSLAEFVVNKNKLRSMVPGTKYAPKKVSAGAWTKSLLAVTWKNYIRIKRNPPVLIFEFILPAVQVILFCLCIGGDPFDVPLAVVNDEVIPQASKFFLDAIDKKTIRQVPFDNLTDAIESVRRGETWGAIHIPDRYTQFLQERLTNPADITNETLTNGTINIYPDLTNLHLALAMENTFREAFIKFAKDTLNMFGYDPASAELPIRVEEPVYGTLRRNGYLEFMTPGVVISITYVMATGLTALAFILEKRDGLLERSLVSGVTTSQILLAHASVQVLVMTIQISLVLAFVFFVFDIPSNGPFFWVVLLILLQGCTGMGFGLLVSALCEEENTAVMMLVGTFYTNLILAGIIWPLEAMPRWIRWLSYMQPQTLPTEALRNILSRGWGIAESGVYLGFVITIGWLVVFLLAAGVAMRYSK